MFIRPFRKLALFFNLATNERGWSAQKNWLCSFKLPHSRKAPSGEMRDDGGEKIDDLPCVPRPLLLPPDSLISCRVFT